MERQPLYQNIQKNQFIYRNNKNGGISSNIILITTQICVWLFIISAFINPNYSSIAIFTYFLYVIIELCSHTSRFLLNKKTTNSIYNKLKELFISPPVLQLSISCYHLEKRIQENRTEDNRIVQNEITERVETYKERRDFPYYSFRDISGLFKFDLNDDNFKNKTYIKLTLDSMISFADSISYYDYQIFKNNFINENSKKDINIDFKENFYISNLTKNNLIRIKDEEPFYVNFFFFFICTILTMALPYEIILNNISIEGKYQIKKIISTRYNLNDYEYDGMYGNLIPSIKLGKNIYNFNSEDYGYYNQDVDINLPSLEEIENAKQYEEEIKKPIFDDHSNDDLDLPTEEEINFLNKNKKYE